MKFSTSESDPDQIGCLLLHGLTGTPEVLKGLGEYLSQFKIEVSIPLLPGHGTNLRSLKSTKWKSWYQVAETALLELQKSCKSVFIVGFSMGGAVSLLLASNYKPNGIITLAAPIRLHPGLRYILPVAKHILPYWKKSWQPYYRKQRYKKEITYDAYPLATVQQLDAMLRFARKQLHRVDCPILLMHGFGDQRVSFHNASIINALVGSKDKRMIFMDEKRHTITQGENAPEVFKTVSNFILNQASRGR